MSQKKLKIVTTSWDDGDIRDLRIADLLRSRGMRGTFYVPIEPFNGSPSLSHDDLRSLAAEGFEIGGHSIGHEIMSQISAQKVDHVVTTCKAILEDTLGERVRMFCYPRGRYSGQVVEALKKAGYDGARTVRLLATETKYGPYDLPTSTQVYPHTRTEYVRNIARARNLGRLYDYMTRLSFDDDWIAIGKKLFDRVLEEGGIWHLWGHSWEIDQLGLWDQMPEMLDYVCGREDVLYLNNGDLVQYLASHAN
ncbi:MAG: polysaccharide deacetylase family protein [bacterium]